MRVAEDQEPWSCPGHFGVEDRRWVGSRVRPASGLQTLDGLLSSLEVLRVRAVRVCADGNGLIVPPIVDATGSMTKLVLDGVGDAAAVALRAGTAAVVYGGGHARGRLDFRVGADLDHVPGSWVVGGRQLGELAPILSEYRKAAGTVRARQKWTPARHLNEPTGTARGTA